VIESSVVVNALSLVYILTSKTNSFVRVWSRALNGIQVKDVLVATGGITNTNTFIPDRLIVLFADGMKNELVWSGPALGEEGTKLLVWGSLVSLLSLQTVICYLPLIAHTAFGVTCIMETRCGLACFLPNVASSILPLPKACCLPRWRCPRTRSTSILGFSTPVCVIDD